MGFIFSGGVVRVYLVGFGVMVFFWERKGGKDC